MAWLAYFIDNDIGRISMFDYIQDPKKSLPHKTRGPLFGLHHSSTCCGTQRN